MKTVMLTANQKLEIVDIPLGKLKSDECRVKVVNVGICSSDIYRGFDNGAYFYPLVMGHEMSGVVSEVGEGVTKYKEGDRVVMFPLLPCFECEACEREAYQQCHDYSYYGSRQHGAYSEYLDVKEWNLLQIPDEVAFEDAAAIEPLSVVIHALKRAKLYKEDKKLSVAIIGSGFLGLLMCQVLQKYSPLCDVTIFDRNEFKLKLAHKYVNKTHQVINTVQWNKYLKEKRDSYQVVIEATGVPSLFEKSIQLATSNGKVIWMGNIIDDLTLSKQNISSILRKELQIIGTWNSDYGHKSNDWVDSIEMLQKGIKPSTFITDRAQIGEVPGILKKLYQHKSGGEEFNSIKVMACGELFNAF